MKNFYLIVMWLVTLTLFTGCETDDSSQGAQNQGPMPVSVVKPETREVVEWDEFTGRFDAVKHVEVRPRVGGYIESVLFTDGQVVEKGQPLYELDKRPFEIALAGARSQLELTKKEVARASNLRKNNAISQEEYDRRVQEQAAAQASFDQAQLNLDFATVVAPITGRIDRTYIDEGNLVAAGENTLSTIVALQPIHFYFNASERDVLVYVRRKINKPDTTTGRGDFWPVYIKLQDEDEYVHEGNIDFVGNAIDESAGTLEIRATLPNNDEFLQPGMFGRLRIAPEEPFEAFVIPDKLIMSQGNQKLVFVVGDDNTVQPRPVEAGDLVEDDQRIIKGGISADDQIIASGLMMLQPGMPVYVKSAKTGAN